MNPFKNFDWKHAALLAGSTFAGGVWTYCQKDGATADPMAFAATLEHWSTAAPIVFGALMSGVGSLALMARKTWLPEAEAEILATVPKLPPAPAVPKT